MSIFIIFALLCIIGGKEGEVAFLLTKYFYSELFVLKCI